MGKRTYLSVTILFIFSTIIVTYIVYQRRVPNSVHPGLWETAGYCNAAATWLEGYVANADPVLGVDAAGFADYIQQVHVFSKDAPAEGYTSSSDLGIYLILPTHLDSGNPVVVGYSDRVADKKGNLYRWVFVLQKGNVTSVSLSTRKTGLLLRGDFARERRPDFYAWPHRAQYLRDIEMKEGGRLEIDDQ